MRCIFQPGRLALTGIFGVTLLLAQATAASAEAGLAGSTTPAGSYAVHLPTMGQLQAGGAATVVGLQVTCPRKAGQLFVEAELAQAGTTSVGMQNNNNVFTSCKGSPQTVTFLLTAGPTAPSFSASPARLSVDVSFANNRLNITRVGNISLTAQAIVNPAVHAIRRLARGAALAIDVTVPCTKDGQSDVIGSVSQRLTYATAQEAIIRQGIFCHRPSVTTTLYASPPAHPWTTQPAAVGVDDNCFNSCRFLGIISSLAVTS